QGRGDAERRRGRPATPDERAGDVDLGSESGRHSAGGTIQPKSRAGAIASLRLPAEEKVGPLSEAPHALSRLCGFEWKKSEPVPSKIDAAVQQRLIDAHEDLRNS